MTIVYTRSISAMNTMYALRQKLGELRHWGHFLSDCIKNRTRLCGYQLLPVCKVKDGTAFRPMYSVSDVRDFINKVLAADPSAGKAPITVVTLPIDTAKGWRVRKFDKHLAPVALLRGTVNMMTAHV